MPGDACGVPGLAQQPAREVAMHPHCPTLLWSSVDCSGGPEACWPWTRTRTPCGYGTIWPARRHAYGHRLASELAVGPIPAGLCVLPHGDHPPCCHPAQLFVGTQADNTVDAIRAGARTGKSRAEPGRTDGVNASTVSRLVAGLIWRDEEQRHPGALLEA